MISHVAGGRSMGGDHLLSVSGDTSKVELTRRAVKARLLGDDALCDLIEDDAHNLRAQHVRVDLGRYLEAIPDILQRPALLDTAIDMALRLQAESDASMAEVAERLCREHPGLADAIRTASFLDAAIVTTSGDFTTAAAPPSVSRLPCGIGPVWRGVEQRYELRELLGKGSQGTVYRAVDRSMSGSERPAWVAVKVLRREISAEEDLSPDSAEAVRARQISHPGVVRVLDRGECDVGRFIVFELVEGATLHDHVAEQGGRLDGRAAAGIAKQIAEGVAAAHAAGVVHRDLKPANVLFAKNGVSKITDFGIGVGPAELFHAGNAPRGALAFIAPEQYCRANTAGDPAVDVYAIGAILYWLLTGLHPNGRDARQIEEHLSTTQPSKWPLDPSGLLGAQDVDLVAICTRAMAFDPSERYQTIGALVADLERFLRHEPLPGRNVPWGRRLTLLRKRSPLLVLVGGIALALAVSVPALSAWIITKREGQLAHEAVRLAEAQTAAAEREAAAAKSKVASAKRLSEIMQSMIGRVPEHLNQNRWLPALSSLESVYGPDALGIDELRVAAVEQRLKALRQKVGEARENGTSDHLDSMLFESLLGYWLLRDGHAAEAAEILRENVVRWNRSMSASDPWVVGINAVAAAAVVESDPGDEPPNMELRAARNLLRELDLDAVIEPFRDVVFDALHRLD